MTGMFNVTTDHFDPLYGNEQIKEYLSAAVENGSLSHAYIIEGPSGSGKHTLATAIACSLAPASAKKIRNGNCPDVLLISHEENRKTIGVDAIRALKETASLTSSELDFKVFIIEEADTMTVQAQNAFLKTLEEPKQDIYILLLCESSVSLLPTILSRAPIMRMQIFNDDELDFYITENEKKAMELKKKDPESYQFIIRSAAGRIGEVKKKLAPRSSAGDIELFQKTRQYIKILSSFKKSEFYIFSNTLATKREELSDFLSILEKALRDLIYIKSRISTNDEHEAYRFLFYPDYHSARDDASHFSSEALRTMIQTVSKTHENLFMNVNLKTTSILFTGIMWNEAHK